MFDSKSCIYEQCGFVIIRRAPKNHDSYPGILFYIDNMWRDTTTKNVKGFISTQPTWWTDDIEKAYVYQYEGAAKNCLKQIEDLQMRRWSYTQLNPMPWVTSLTKAIKLRDHVIKRHHNKKK